ncbi:hypothetical protein BDW59DRAFT_160543 [Aspergillus cavernicola]|uniref:Uncharacterized protein n=1 Tax=Aspergillus cavernicola TaxID=176166 RepID=A0ABR4IIA4_9EURO
MADENKLKRTRPAKMGGRLPPPRRTSSIGREKEELEAKEMETVNEAKAEKARENHKSAKNPQESETPKAPESICDPERTCRSPIQLLELEAPIHALGKELGLPDLSKDDQIPRSPGIKRAQSQSLPRIYLGDASPTPRWLIKPVISSSEIGQDLSRQSSGPSGSRLPPLGRLCWEFDPGPYARHGQNEALLRNYAYRYLLNSLCDPIVREEMRDLIWNGPHAAIVVHVEDPLPIPPPPAHIKDQKPSRYVDLPPPISDDAPDEYNFEYPDYSRPSLAARAAKRVRDARNSSANHDETDSSSDSCGSATTIHSYRSGSVESPKSSSYCAIAQSSISSARTRTGTSISTNPNDYRHRSSQHEDEDEDSRGYNTESDSDKHHIQPAPPEEEPPTLPKPTLLKPPKRGRGRPPKAKNPTSYIEVPTLDEIASAATATANPRLPILQRKRRRRRGGGGRGTKRAKAADAWKSPPASPSPEVFSDEEEIRLPRLPRGAKKRARLGSGDAWRPGEGFGSDGDGDGDYAGSGPGDEDEDEEKRVLVSEALKKVKVKRKVAKVKGMVKAKVKAKGVGKRKKMARRK